VKTWTAIVIVLVLAACGVKAPPRPPTAAEKDVPEAQGAR